MKGPLTSKVKLLQGRVLPQRLRTLDPDIVICATSQANDIRGVVRESCPIQIRWERANNKAPLTSKVKLLQGEVRQQRLGQHFCSLVSDLVTCATSQANDI